MDKARGYGDLLWSALTSRPNSFASVATASAAAWQRLVAAM